MNQESFDGIEKSFKDTEAKVRDILSNEKKTRNCDICLIVEFYRIHHPGTDFSNLHGKTSFETIRRTRQKIQASGDYLSTGKCLEERRKKEEAVRNYVRSDIDEEL